MRLAEHPRLLNRPLLPLAVSLGLLWFVLINQLWGAWAADPQYSYGFVVPAMCLVLLWKRWSDSVWPHRVDPTCQQSPVGRRREVVVIALCGFLVLPTRLILEANPDWRMFNWFLAIETVVLTLCLTYAFGGRRYLRQFCFPVAFILVAVPWPFSIERPLIQGLTRANVAATIEALSWLGIPAIQHGSVIEVITGFVNVDEACSGIRSFQSSLMVSIFFGEVFRLALGRRLILVSAGLLLAFGFNACRTTFLSLVAARKGVDAISGYHDLVGVTILLACTVVLAALAFFLSKRPRSVGQGPKSTSDCPRSSGFRLPSSNLIRLSLALLVWLVIVEAGVELWYRAHENHAASVPSWTIAWPPPYPGFSELPVSTRVREILSYDEGHSGRWQTEGGATWNMNYFRWRPGKSQAWLAAIHTPDVCMAAMGHALRERKSQTIRVGSVDLPFKIYTYEEAGTLFRVYHCFWNQSSAGREFQTTEPNKFQRLRAMLMGHRNLGEQTLQISVQGIQDESEATKAVATQLKSAILAVPRAEVIAAPPRTAASS